MVLLQTSPCDQYECQNGAQCIVVQQEPTCRCPPGFAGPRCEKLITVNFVGKDSYVELASAKVRPQANISLQVRFTPTCPQAPTVLRTATGIRPTPDWLSPQMAAPTPIHLPRKYSDVLCQKLCWPWGFNGGQDRQRPLSRAR